MVWKHNVVEPMPWEGRSESLAEQVQGALFELVRGFQAANDHPAGRFLDEVLAEDPNRVYSGLLTILMRLVFLLYAEHRGLLFRAPAHRHHQLVTRLFERLEADAKRFPDTMDRRYGAWDQLLTVFRRIHDGGRHEGLPIPPRKGTLFDPDQYGFLEGRPQKAERTAECGPFPVPLVSDGAVYRVLGSLLVLDGERLSYRSVDVEQIGGVYERLVGFKLKVARGRSIAVKPTNAHGAPITINLDELLDTKPARRPQWLKAHTQHVMTGRGLKDLKRAQCIDDLLAALDRKLAKTVTPNVVPPGAMVLQPSDQRRRSGSHYTPRSLTEPIVRRTLEPILQRLAEAVRAGHEPRPVSPAGVTEDEAKEYGRACPATGPTPQQILNLKVCDPAMGSGAFLVEACRQLGDHLVKAWHAHDCVPQDTPPGEDESWYARRLVAPRCLYGVDKDPMAVDLAKLSLWLTTLAQDSPYTFLDHNLRHGDSLVGLSRRQIIDFYWEPKPQRDSEGGIIESRIVRATEERRRIANAHNDGPYVDRAQRLALAETALGGLRLIGDACVSTFFARKKKKEREEQCDRTFARLSDWFANGMTPRHESPLAEAAARLRRGEHAVFPFHWEIEFPEVFLRDDGGFDAVVGNPPFMAKNTMARALHPHYGDYLQTAYPQSNGKSDLVSFFFRRAFQLLRRHGCLGLIATKTVAQGDTRSAGLTYVATHGGDIYRARRRFPWPGVASVSVSVVHICRGAANVPRTLDGRPVGRITAFLVPQGPDTDPAPLAANLNLGFQGCNLSGQGFLFDDHDDRATPVAVMNAILKRHPGYASQIRPFIGGTEINSRPDLGSDRYVIDLGRVPLHEADRQWPELVAILRDKVKPDRETRPRNKQSLALAARWWQWHTDRPTLQRAREGMSRVLVASSVTAHLGFVFQPTTRVFAHTLNVFAVESYSAFASMQCRVHEIWVRFFASSLEDRLRYTITDSFETFPFPIDWTGRERLENVGCDYERQRKRIMESRHLGLTEVYNRFHDPHERSPEITTLRQLHDAMDQAVLSAYGWDDLAGQARAEFGGNDGGEDGDEETGRCAKNGKGWRLRWPEGFRDEVLARLLELNVQRAREERRLAATADART